MLAALAGCLRLTRGWYRVLPVSAALQAAAVRAPVEAGKQRVASPPGSAGGAGGHVTLGPGQWARLRALSLAGRSGAPETRPAFGAHLAGADGARPARDCG